MQSSRVLARSLNRLAQRRGAHGGHSVVQSSYNDLPQPSGSWQTNHDSKQRKYNAQLLFGTGLLAGTIIFGKSAGLLEFYGDTPERPATIESYK